MEPEALCRFSVIIILCKLGTPVAVAILPALELAVAIPGYIFILTSYSHFPYEDCLLGSDAQTLIEDLRKSLCVGLDCWSLQLVKMNTIVQVQSFMSAALQWFGMLGALSSPYLAFQADYSPYSKSKYSVPINRDKVCIGETTSLFAAYFLRLVHLCSKELLRWHQRIEWSEAFGQTNRKLKRSRNSLRFIRKQQINSTNIYFTFIVRHIYFTFIVRLWIYCLGNSTDLRGAEWHFAWWRCSPKN